MERTWREAVRMQAAELFAANVVPAEIASRLRVSPKSVYQWHRVWRVGGVAALVSRGPLGASCRLSVRSQQKLAVMLEEGSAAHGWDEDQVWTGARVTRLIGRRFHVSYSASEGATRLMRRLGFTPQAPARRAIERDEQAITAWREVV